MATEAVEVDVLCVGHACYDMVFSVSRHPQADEKIFAENLISSGGGPAANAAVTVSRLGLTAGFAGYLGEDLYGEMHLKEFEKENVDTHLIVRGKSPTPLSTILVKPDGKRALINYKGATQSLPAEAINFSSVTAKTILLDGHEPQLSLALVELVRNQKIPTVLDAGSFHEGTSKLLGRVDYLVASEKFACQFAENIQKALELLAEQSPAVIITLGDKGLIWKCGSQSGRFPAFPVNTIDTTGAGDAFHGAFAAAVAIGMDWQDILAYSSAAGALCCTITGARQGLPYCQEHRKLVEQYNKA